MHNILLFFFLFNLIQPSFAHHKIYSPRINKDRLSLEWRGHFDVDSRSDKNKYHNHVLETEYSWTNYWQSEVEVHLRNKDDNNFRWFQTEFQNQFQIINRETWAAALYFSYNWVREKGEADAIEYKVLLEKNLFEFTNILNLVFENEFGSKAEGSTEFKVSYLSMFNKPIYKGIKIGFEGFSNLGQLDNFNSPGRQKHQIGLGFKKSFHLTDNVEYDFSIVPLIGLTNASADRTLLWNMELEF